MILQKQLKLKILKMHERHFKNTGKGQDPKVTVKFMNSMNIEFNHRPEMNSQNVEQKAMNLKDKQTGDLMVLWTNKSNPQKDVSLFKIQNQCTVKKL